MEKETAFLRRALDTFRFTLGEDILKYLKDDDVFELMVNPDRRLWIDTFSKGRMDTGVRMEPRISKQIIYQVASLTNQVCTVDHPTLAAELPDGSRFQGFLPRVVASPAFNIRKHLSRIMTLQDYVNEGIMTQKQRNVVLKAIYDKKNIIAAGGTKSGKTTFLNAILAEISKTEDRVVMIEDTPELKCAAPNVLSLRTTDTIDQAYLLKCTLRATPDRIVVGEVRGGEALALLDAWSTGHGGGCSTVHSNSAPQTLLRLQGMISRVSLTPQQATIAEAVDVVVYLKRKGTSRIIEEIISVNGYDEEKKAYVLKKIG